MNEEQEYESGTKKRGILFAAALLHDIGKAVCTVSEDGVWKSPDHTIVGEKIARELLWREFGLAGTGELQEIRECICAMIRNHSLTQHYLEQTAPEKKLIKAAAMDLFHRYHASVRIVFLETGWDTEILRNQSREDAVLLSVIQRLLRNLEPSAPWEAKRVEWYCV